MERSEELVRELPKGLLQWYDFKDGSHILYIGNRKDPYMEALAEQPLTVSCVTCEDACDREWQKKHTGEFDYVVSVVVLEQRQDAEEALYAWRSLLNASGKMLLGMNNRLGLRYFCGDRDPYTGRNFDGIEDYRGVYVKKEDTFAGRCYNRHELGEMVKNAGFETFRFYSVLPDLENPCLIYAEGVLPNEDLANRLFPTYNYPDTVFLEEEGIYTALEENGMFHQMANAYLIECSMGDRLSDVLHVTGSMERGRERALFTIIHENGIVEKKAAYPEGEHCLTELESYLKDLSSHGVPVVEMEMKGTSCIMPHIQAEVGQIYLEKLLKTDKNQFLQEMDRFREMILQSSETAEPDKGDGSGVILRRGYPDMVPLNSFYMDETFVFFDQEFCMENYPANAVITRMINTFYAGSLYLQKYLPVQELYDRYGLTTQLQHWLEMEKEFLTKLRKEKELCKYRRNRRRDTETLHTNRQKINYSTNKYQKLFVDIFEDLNTKKLVLFGSGRYTEKFLELYAKDYPVHAVIDNSPSRQGKDIAGIKIQSPEILKSLQNSEFKVIICIKNCLSIIKQLDSMGISGYGIFDPGRTYPRKWKLASAAQDTSGSVKQKTPKKYHTGYIAGVFDLFHVGHLNMFKRAKEQCDYLIVGIVSDKGVKQYKKVEPFIPFEERIEMVRSCRYVDEAVEIPLTCHGTRDAYRLYQFDVQFSGSDYADDPDWLADQAFLEKYGAEMVFFPYTETTSSSRIKELIEKKLL